MPFTWKPAAVSAAGVLLLAGAVLVLTPSPAAAQCGSQASSCKNCHEVQAQDPVNAVGAWHVSHAFGDFCEFCHAGNVQTTDAEAAHTGMVAPLADPQASCSACHPDDAHDLAVTYATALGVEVGAGGGAGPSPAATEAPTPSVAPPAASADLPAGPVIDYNAQYADSVEGKLPINAGNLILGVLIGVIALGGGGYVYWRERRRRSPPSPTRQEAPATEAAQPRASAIAPAEPLTAAIAALDPLGRRALERLLRDPQSASDLLRRLARLDPDVIRTLRGLDRETRALLLALTSD